ncbi:RcnB family protein [Polaromonas sp.]|uniref:RcnB family protein n=1 Tax=Polaromonas sp. TaxID=1869339 RepID=UPI003263645C
MKSKALVCAITLASLGFSSLSFAEGYDRRGRGAEPQRFEQPGPMHRDGHDFNARHLDRQDMRHDRYADARGPRFHRGDRVPTEYRHRGYAMNNWRAQHLNAPAHDQQWVQVGADYALIAIATGVIAQLVLSR